MVGREETYSAFVKTRGDKCLHVDPNVIAVSDLRDFLPHPTLKKKLIIFPDQLHADLNVIRTKVLCCVS